MPALLYGIGIFALFAGLMMVGFGIPINEFSFGNTLISAGTTAAVGGLIIIGLGVLTGQVRRLSQTLAMQEPGQRQPIETPEIADATAQVRVPFPARSRPEPHTAAHAGAAMSTAAPFEDLAESVVPTLRNPDESTVAAEDDVSLSPRHPLAPASPGAGDLGGPRAGSGPAPGSMPDKSREPAAGWRSVAVSSTSASQERPIHTANFDAMWPAEVKLPKASTGTPLEAKPEPSSHDTVSRRREAEPQKARSPAVLRSGVVDGMGYTLYVDGSIEAELPQGTLRFASINELRSHLAKKS
ncbi:MAG TPA: hypothetical protein VIY07_07840 [Pseudolabrys sp.]